MRVVWHCEDRAGPAMAGPAIRAVELAARLARVHQVTLVCPGATTLPAPPFAVAEHAAGQSLLPFLGGNGGAGAAWDGRRPQGRSSADVLVTQGFGFARGDLARLPAGLRLVLDLYDPVQLELLLRLREDESAQGRLHLAFVRRRLLALVARADHVLCASKRQRALWLGWLGAVGRLTLPALRDDPEARSLLALVPFGIPAQAAPAVAASASACALASASAPASAAGALPVRPGEAAVLWWGGLWDWMDPLTAIRAIARVRAQGVRAALVLPANNRPGAAAMAVAARAEGEARALDLWGSGVVQLPRWVPYAERSALLRAAAVAVSCHRPSLEAELSFRTRLLDCVWAGLPAVATAGDELSSRAAREGWARTVPPGDSDALADALIRLLAPAEQASCRAAAAAAAPGYSWDLPAATLLALLEAPRPPRAPAWAALAPELYGAAPGDLAQAAARKLLSRLRRLFS